MARRRPTLVRMATMLVVLVLADPLVARTAGALPGPDRPDASPEGSDPSVTYRPPVDGPLVDGFRLPARPWLPGNRGHEYATAPGQEVRAAAAGLVLFAGSVARTRHVTLRHADGLRTSYSFLALVSVRAGDEVAAGDVVGRAARTVHFGVRDPDGTYLDPGLLLGGSATHRPLLAFHEEGAIRSAARSLLGDERSFLEQVVASVEATARWAGLQVVDGAGAGIRLAAASGRQAVGGLVWYVERPIVAAASLLDLGTDLVSALPAPACISAEERVDLPAGPRVAVLVPGLDAGATGGPIADLDLRSLGLRPEDVVLFSYGETDSSYRKADAHRPVAESASRLAGLLRSVIVSHPGATLEVYGHSLGGLVGLEAVALVAADPDPPPLRLVTLATPHGGSPLAAAGDLLGGLAGVAEAFGMVGRAEVGAPVLADLAAGATRPVPPGVEALSLAGSGDLLVPAGRTALDGARTVVVDLLGADVHGSLVGHRRTTREISLFLGGRDAACRSLAARLGGVVVPYLAEAAHQVVTVSDLAGALR